MGIRDDLLEAIEAQAALRDMKAVEYPDDRRNERSAGALRVLHRRLATLPPEYMLLLRLGQLWHRSEDSDVLVALSRREHEVLRLYGFGGCELDPESAGDPDLFLRQLIREFESELASTNL